MLLENCAHKQRGNGRVTPAGCTEKTLKCSEVIVATNTCFPAELVFPLSSPVRTCRRQQRFLVRRDDKLLDSVPLTSVVTCRFQLVQDIVGRFGPSLKDPAAAEPVDYDEHFDRLLKEAERGSTAAGRRASTSPMASNVRIRRAAAEKLMANMHTCACDACFLRERRVRVESDHLLCAADSFWYLHHL